jgi:AcrR family transcriptional regulator
MAELLTQVILRYCFSVPRPVSPKKRRRGAAAITQPRPPRGRPGGRSARIRSQVLEAGFAVFVEKGFEGFTMAEVADRAGVHETSLYRRWKTRGALAMDCCLHYAKAAIPTPDTGSLRSDLVAMLDSVVALYSSPQGQALLRMSTLQGAHTAARDEFVQRRFDLARAIFDRAIQRGEFPADSDGMIVLEALLAPLFMRVLLNRPLSDWPRNEMVDRLLSTYTSRSQVS